MTRTASPRGYSRSIDTRLTQEETTKARVLDKNPITKQPMRLTVNVPNGKSMLLLTDWIHVPSK